MSEPEWTELANDIRVVDGNHDLGAGALAAALTERGWTKARGPLYGISKDVWSALAIAVTWSETAA